MRRSISGGERRRVSLGVSLAGAPLCLFLDEPTSGLDSSSALSLFQLLKELAAGGLTVVAVVHQPRAEVFAATDDLIVLGTGGCLFYSGPSVRVARRRILPSMTLPSGGREAVAAGSRRRGAQRLQHRGHHHRHGHRRCPQP
jgi:ABC-type multidrug transport system ATPase subunit